MKGELSNKNQQLQNLVDQLLSKQAKKYTTLKDLFTDIKDGKVDVDRLRSHRHRKTWLTMATGV